MKNKYLILISLLVGVFQLTAQDPHFYGVTTNGSGSGAGTIFRSDTNGTNVTIIDTFDILQNGSRPINQELLEVNGKMYGVTNRGGDNNVGVLFEFDPATGNYIVRHNFNDSTGHYPQGYLLLGTNGKIYGTAQQGGQYYNGTLFEYNTTTNVLSRKVSFNYAVTGRYPIGKLIEVSSGVFYGVCNQGGSIGWGTVYKYTLSTNTLEKKDEFNNTANGRSPKGGLMKASNGKLYGMTTYGGTNAKGTLFQYDLSEDSIKTLVQFNGLNGNHGQGVPIQLGGYLYGLTFYGNYSSSTGKGLLFRYDIANDTIIRVRTFGSVITGYYPTGELVPSSSGKFLILLATGGVNNYAGAISEFTLSTNSLVNQASFNRSLNGSYPVGNLKKSTVNGKYYGVATYGGSGDYGTLFEFDDVLDTIINKHSFSPSDGGKEPTGTLVKAPNGKLYGVTSHGGVYGLGTIFEVDPISHVVTKKADFEPSTGGDPVGGLTLANNGKLYGVNQQGGTYNRGVLFEYNITTNALVKKKDIYPAGSYPRAGLMLASNGKLYGTTSQGGIYGAGNIISYDIGLDTLTNEANFNQYVNGRYPYSRLLQATNGKFYGTTNSGGAQNRGNVFEYDMALDTIREIDFFNDSNGAYPRSGLTQIANGNIYGMTSGGNITGVGSNRYGVVFQVDLIGDSIKELVNFNRYTHGYGGLGEFLEASNGKLYATSYYTYQGNNGATINEFNPVTNTLTPKSRVPGSTYGSLIELVAPNNASVDEKEITNEFLVYPNPTNSLLTIDTKGERIIGVKIFDISGKLINSKLSSNKTIDVSQLTNGLYILQIETQNGTALSRFIKN